MAAPNIAGSSVTVTGETWVLAATNTETDIIAAVATGHCVRVEAVYASNIHASTNGWVSLIHRRGGVSYRITYQLAVPIGTSVNLLGGRILYLEEGDALRATANQSSNIEVIATGEDIA